MAEEGYQTKKYQGNWKCADCDTEITELPFEPKEGQDVRCYDCYKKYRDKSKAA